MNNTDNTKYTTVIITIIIAMILINEGEKSLACLEQLQYPPWQRLFTAGGGGGGGAVAAAAAAYGGGCD